MVSANLIGVILRNVEQDSFMDFEQKEENFTTMITVLSGHISSLLEKLGETFVLFLAGPTKGGTALDFHCPVCVCVSS